MVTSVNQNQNGLEGGSLVPGVLGDVVGVVMVSLEWQIAGVAVQPNKGSSSDSVGALTKSNGASEGEQGKLWHSYSRRRGAMEGREPLEA